MATICGKIVQHFSPPTKICFLCLCANCQTKGDAAAIEIEAKERPRERQTLEDWGWNSSIISPNTEQSPVYLL